ncbi:MAG: acetylxylan esterase [Thermoguttaceae bacterium]|jgi:dienelactone hydrolase|nr:acetylxylan esterase [Thermoguttaceae bacterium]
MAPRGFVVVCLLFGAGLCPAVDGQADESAELLAILQREIVGPVLPMTEVQHYCDRRVPEMPEVKTVAEWEQQAERMRREVLERIVFRGEAARWRDAPAKVEWLDTIDGGPGYRIRKLRFEALPGLWIPALLYEPENLSGKVPVVLNVNGHTGLGKQYPPKQIRCINQAKRGMLALNVEWVGMGQLRGAGFGHYCMNQLDLCGTSGLAPFYLNMTRAIDVLLDLEHADPARVAVAGLSGGGWQTIVVSSLDTRVTLANPVAGYSSFKTRAWHLKDLGDSEQTPNDLATVADYAHLTAMLAPRPALLTFNLHDACCFEGAYALKPLLDAAEPIYHLYGKESALRSYVSDDPPGEHHFGLDNRRQLYRMFGDFFYAGDDTFNAEEIPSDDEVQSAEALHVELPEANEDFNTLALQLAASLPRDAALPAEADAAAAWQQAGRAKLRDIVRAKDYEVNAITAGDEEKDDVKATFWRLQMGGEWTVPAVELVRGEPDKTALLVTDEGRAAAAGKAAELLAAGYRVIAADPFYFGESKIAQRDFLFALLVAAVGDRPIGLQASQVAAIARWSAAKHAGPVTVIALGTRSSAFALIAAALEEKAIGSVELHGSLGSLREVVEQNWTVNQKPELFCFGLLEAFDVKQLAALVAPRPARFMAPSERAKNELAGLAGWYQLWGIEFDPLRE